jgi:hypothetical protein
VEQEEEPILYKIFNITAKRNVANFDVRLV